MISYRPTHTKINENKINENKIIIFINKYYRCLSIHTCIVYSSNNHSSYAHAYVQAYLEGTWRLSAMVSEDKHAAHNYPIIQCSECHRRGS